jgi:hypothetical protein
METLLKEDVERGQPRQEDVKTETRLPSGLVTGEDRNADQNGNRDNGRDNVNIETPKPTSELGDVRLDGPRVAIGCQEKICKQHTARGRRANDKERHEERSHLFAEWLIRHVAAGSPSLAPELPERRPCDVSLS